MAATRPSSAIRAGSPDSSRWWETEDFAEFTKAARAHRVAGDFAGQESVYAEGYQRARKLGHVPAQISYLSNLGTARMLALRYAPALEAYLEARALAERAGDWFSLGGIAVNLSWVYQRLGDPDAALSALERGKAAMDRLQIPPYYKAQLLMSLRSIRAESQENPTEPSYEEAIEAARQTDDPEAGVLVEANEARAWDLLGQEKIAAGDLEGAEAALGRALRLRMSNAPKSLGFSYAALGALRLAQAERSSGKDRRKLAKEAEALTQRAIDFRSPGPAVSMLLRQRGQIREALDQPELALADFETAVNQASEWNGAIPPALSLLTSANVVLQNDLFDSFVEAAARYALRTGNQTWAAAAFMALEANRASSLRESRDLAPVWRQRLPAAYWETLGRLNDAEASGLSAGGTLSAEVRRLRLKLTEMESVAGLGVSVRLAENFRARNSLIHFQQGLGESDLVLSFYLGRQASYLWAVTRSGIKLYRLPAESEVRQEVKQFRDTLASSVAGGGSAAGDKLGADLYKRLFRSLDPVDAAKTSWLLSLDGALFDLPFAALVSGYEHGRPIYAAERHSTQVIPGALFLRQQAAPKGGYLGVADPVYNWADPRETAGWRLRKNHRDEQGQLNRLVSSSRELQRSSASWQMDPGVAHPTQILEGTAARRNNFLQALTVAPSTIHLATHVLSAATGRGQGFLAFSLNADGHPDLLSATDIGMLRVPGALVVMTGCATGTGDPRVGAGLLGLTRAWMMAGARAVVATNWPVPDADGDLIPGFYQHLRSNLAAEALRRSQVEAIYSGTWQASPSFWAAFQVTGGGR